MARAIDVAAYILKRQGPMTTMKLQKLVYYCQAWHATWEDEPLFRAKIRAWANGPVCPDLYRRHRGMFRVGLRTAAVWGADCSQLKEHERESIDIVLGSYGDKSAQFLSDLTHREPPWHDARKGFAPHERGSEEITLERMVEYYGSLIASG
jgi:uncharacterized phage-associated protein